MEIGKYKQAMSYLLNQNATLKTFTINPEAKFIDNDPQPVIGFKTGGRVGFAPGGIVSNEKKLEKLKQIILESNSNPFKSISKNQAVLTAGYKNPSNLEARKKIKDLLNTLVPLEEKFSNHLNNIMNNLDSIPYQEIIKEGGLNKYISKPFGVNRIAGSRKINSIYSKPEFKEARDIVRLLSNPQVFDTYGNKEMFAGEVLDNLDVKKSATRLRGGKLEDDIVNVAMRSSEAGNKNIKFLTKPGTVDASDIVFEWNGKLYGKNTDEYKGKKINNLTTDLYKLPEFNEYLNSRNKLEELKGKETIHPVTGKKITYDQLLRETYAKGFNNDSFYKFSGLDLDHKDIKNKPFSDVRPLPRHINAVASPLNKKTFSIVKDKEKFLQEVGYNIPEESLEKSILNFSNRVLNENKPISKTYQSGLQAITGASKEYFTPISKLETEALEMEKKSAKEFVKGETQVMTSSGLRPVSEKETKIPKEFSKQKSNTIDYLIDYLDKNPKEVKAFRAAGITCRRSVGGKIDTECLAENIVKEVEKLETGTDLQKTSALNKFKNATKLGAGLVEEVVGFGRGVAGRTVGPLAALNSALEQWTSGNYREGFRKIGSLADLTTLVGDPLGFEKMRTEGTIEDVRGKIGKENQASLDRILEFKDKYYQLQDINTKLKRAKSAAQGQYDSETPGVDPNYINELEKQQNNLNKIINSPKYQNIRKDYLNVGNAVKNEIFGRNINAPEQNKYIFETAAQEQLKSILGENFYDELSDENKIIFKNLTAIQKINENPISLEIPEIQSPDDSMREGFAEGGGPKMGRRGFLGFLGAGIMAAPEIIKGLKGEKKASQIAKVATKILPEVKGMPEWFPSLVARIENEGKYVGKDTGLTDNLRIKELTIPSKTGKGGDEIYTMIQHPNGDITIEANVKGGAFDGPFELHYSPPKTDMNVETGQPIKEPGDFYIMENRPRSTARSHHDSDFEIDYDVVSPEEAISDIERVERVATGKRIHPKRVEERTAARKYVEENPYDDIVNRYGEADPKDWFEE